MYSNSSTLKDQEKIQSLVVALYLFFFIADATHGFRMCWLILKTSTLLALCMCSLASAIVMCFFLYQWTLPRVQSMYNRLNQLKQTGQNQLQLARQKAWVNKTCIFIGWVMQQTYWITQPIKSLWHFILVILGETTPIGLIPCLLLLKCGYDLSQGLAIGSAIALFYYFSQSLGFSVIQTLVLISQVWLTSYLSLIGMHGFNLGFTRLTLPANQYQLSSQSLFCMMAFTGASYHQYQFVKKSRNKPNDRLSSVRMAPFQHSQHPSKQQNQLIALILELIQLSLLLPTPFNAWSNLSQGLKLPQAIHPAVITQGLNSLPMYPLFTCIVSLLIGTTFHHYPLMAISEVLLASLAQGLFSLPLGQWWSSYPQLDRLSTKTLAFQSPAHSGQLVQTLVSARLTMHHHHRILKPLSVEKSQDSYHHTQGIR
jgi:hypothetical protein